MDPSYVFFAAVAAASLAFFLIIRALRKPKPTEQARQDDQDSLQSVKMTLAYNGASRESSPKSRESQKRRPKRIKRASPRRALVIGLSDYEHPLQFSPLPGAKSDAEAVVDCLESFDFYVDRIIGACDSSSLKKRRARFIAQAANAEVILVYYAGHGISYNLNTFLVPTSGLIDEIARDFLYDCLETNELIADFASGIPSAKRIFIFDCCRSQAVSIDPKTQYIGPQEPKFGPNDLVVYSTALTKAAVDEQGTLAKELIVDLCDRAVPFAAALQAACERVSSQSRDGAQIPHIRHRGSAFDQWYLKSEQSDYKAVAPGLKPYELAANITAMAVSSNGRYFAITSGKQSEMRVIPAREFTPYRLTRLMTKAYTADFSPLGDSLVFGCRDGSVGVWFHQLEEPPKVFENSFRGPVNHIEWARKNDRIVGVSHDGTIRAFEAGSFEELGRGTDHESWVWSATIHKDGDFIVTGSRDRTCRLWHLDRTKRHADGYSKLQPCGEPLRFGIPVRAVRFSHSGQRLAVGTQDGRIFLYEFDADEEKFRLDNVIAHKRSAKYAQPDKLVRALNHYRNHKHRPEITERDLDSNVFIISLDFSPDDLVLAYGTNIDGYFTFALDVEQRIGGMEDYINEDRLRRYRAADLIYCTHRRRLYVASGSKVHCLYY